MLSIKEALMDSRREALPVPDHLLERRCHESRLFTALPDIAKTSVHCWVHACKQTLDIYGMLHVSRLTTTPRATYQWP